MKATPSVLALSVLDALASTPTWAAARAMKIGVLNDASGPYSDNAGEGSVTAAKMAAEDFMKTHPDLKVEIVSADHQNKPDGPRRTSPSQSDR